MVLDAPRLLINCLFRSLKQFFWSALLLLMAIYVVAIYITQVAFLQLEWLECSKDLPPFMVKSAQIHRGALRIGVLSHAERRPRPTASRTRRRWAAARVSRAAA